MSSEISHAKYAGQILTEKTFVEGKSNWLGISFLSANKLTETFASINSSHYHQIKSTVTFSPNGT